MLDVSMWRSRDDDECEAMLMLTMMMTRSQVDQSYQERYAMQQKNNENNETIVFIDSVEFDWFHTLGPMTGSFKFCD